MTDASQAQHGDSHALPVVALGASAGGLEPLEAFFSNCPDSTGWAYIVIQHLSPDYRSMMDELLSRRSKMRIEHIEDGMRLEPNTIYLNQPNQTVELVGDHFVTTAFGERGHRPPMPIDALFRSLVERPPEATVAIILSGSGTDGTRGAQILHNADATVLAQAPAQAAFSSMPRSVLTAGAVDRVLEVEEMPEAISIVFTMGKKGRGALTEMEGSASQAILKLLERKYHVDFSSYKPINVQRRIDRRQHLRGLPSLEAYRVLLSEDANALEELYQDLLIGVTEFYRDPEAIRILRKDALDELVERSDDDAPLRIWIPGCASGEEAYTIAIELSEALEAARLDRKFRIIATDVHRRSIDIASAGIYSETSVAKVPAELRAKYFIQHRDQYIIEPKLRQSIIFSVHDALSDPPFMNLDLVSCRNLLIYLNEEPQARIISMFLFGLRKDGFLLLGPSETIGRFGPEFKQINARWRLFQKASSRRVLDRNILSHQLGSATRNSERAPVTSARPAPRRNAATNSTFFDMSHREMLIAGYDALLKRYAPSSILVTTDGHVLSWFGAASAFIDTMNNLAEWTVDEIVHRDLQFPIKVGMERLRQGVLDISSREVKVDMGGGRLRSVVLRIEPLDQLTRSRLMLVDITFREASETDAEDAPPKSAKPISFNEDVLLLTRRIQELERDLRLTEETLQHVTERLEASGEELQASNEELQASNEELQASNEELQSSNEELHAVNEELVTLSTEHELQIDKLSELNEHTDTVLRKLRVGVIFVDSDLRIRRFSDLVGAHFLLEAHDVNRPLAVVTPKLSFIDLPKLAREVISSKTSRNAEGDHEGHHLRIEVHPMMQKSTTQAEPTTGAMLLFHGIDTTPA
ncbi:chemotaxis protein CheB [Thioclava sp. GXIMD4216]|uniref:CheR family methyltransferase n=1 Tax=Thioclava litoralis TaxID=3076557 RepID=A0ABZ1DYH6_9RHOB|nr:CheR family methyltransferase [Thioclava sp. FTW29]